MKRMFAIVALSGSVLAVTCSYAAEGAETAAPPDELAIQREIVEKSLPSYKCDLKELITRAECRIRKIDARLTPADYLKAARERVAKGDKLQAEGKETEAIAAWQEALELSKDETLRKDVEARAQKIEDARQAEIAAAAAAAEESRKREEEKLAAARKTADEKLAAEKAAAGTTALPAQPQKPLDESWHKEKPKQAAPPKRPTIGDILDMR